MAKNGIWESIAEYELHEKVSKMTPLEMVREFSSIMGQPLDLDLSVEPSHKVVAMRDRLIREEVEEVLEAYDKENLLKELADLVYVTYGYAATFGLNLDEAVRRVHISNLSKLDENGQPIYREDGKVMKGPNYKSPDLSDLV